MDKITEKIIESVPKVIEEVYSDGASDTLKEVSKFGVDFAKTIRLILFPLQFTAMAQDRLAKYISRCINEIPPENLIKPSESLALQLAEKLKFQEDGNVLTKAYLNLLSRAMDRERVGEAHPAFINIISQLCPDEILLLNQIGKSDYLFLFMLKNKVEAYNETTIDSYINSLSVSENIKLTLRKNAFKRNSIVQPKLLITFLEHMESIGLVIYDEDKHWHMTKEFVGVGSAIYSNLYNPNSDILKFELTKFGELFFKACIRDIQHTE